MWLIFVVAFTLAGGIFAFGVWVWRRGQQEHASRLLTGAMVAFAVLVVQVMIEARAHHDGQLREKQADREGLLLMLGRQANLSGIDLRRQKLTGFYLNGKTLNDADLSDADLGEVRLVRANLVSATLVGADLRAAHLDRADLRQADLSGARLDGAWLRGATLDAATLGRRTVGRRIVRTRLVGAHLQNAFLRADLQYAVLTGANLEGAHLAPANLSHAVLARADLMHADLRGAILLDVNLQKTKHLDEALDLSFAAYNDGTLWPPGFHWKKLRKPCGRPACYLGEQPVDRFPQRMRDLEARLRKLTDGSHCPPGWSTDPSDPYVLRAVSARGLAEFQISAAGVPETTARHWASLYDAGKKRDVQPLTDIHTKLGETYAERYSRGTAPNAREEVAVYQIVKGQGYRYLSSSSAALFPLFERDFATLLVAVGIQGSAFHELDGEQAATC
jgi:uncharacterized protein YjbI with pentapeptide repeats